MSDLALMTDRAPMMPDATLADDRVRARIREDLRSTLIIEAAAGTGKTTALVSRIVAVIAGGLTELNRIVAVTFTEKAAGELKLRLRAEIESGRHDTQRLDAAARARLDGALEQLEEAHIGTIHSFCADLLREWPIAAGLDPVFEIAPEENARMLFEAAFERWFAEALAAPGPALTRILRRRELADRDGPRPLLAAAARTLVEWRDFDAPWRPEEFDRCAAIDALVDDILAADDLAASADERDWLRRAFAQLARPVREAIRLEAVQPRDYDILEDTLIRLLAGNQGHWRWKGFGDQFGTMTRVEALARRDDLRRRLEEFRERAGANLAPLLRDELWPVVDYYDEAKRRAGRLDFLDLLLLTRNLVRDHADVRAELQGRFSHIFVDEFQDTDPLQAEILMLLAADNAAVADWRAAIPVPGKLFVVGDPKQSIYRFRRADVALYQEIKQHLCAHGAAVEHLSVSFRAVPAIQTLVNHAFAPLMPVESETHPAYAPLQPYRSEFAAQPAIVVLPVPHPYSKIGRITDWSIEESLPEAAAAYIEWLVKESGWTVAERDQPDRRVPIRPRHICLLFRRLSSWRGGRAQDMTRAYVRALEARHLEHVLVRGGSFHQREEVEAVRNALNAIERPDDEFSVYATLRGPFFALSDGALLNFRHTFGSLHPFRPLPSAIPADLAEVRDALTVLRELHRGRNRRPAAETIGRLLAATRAHAGIANWPTGEQALANLRRLMDSARRYESSGATSLRGFIDLLEARAEREEAGDSPVVEDGTEGVRIMTVHSAKGLEFPVVMLADLTCNETRDAVRYVEPQARLCVQVLAGARARQLLDHQVEANRRDEEEAIRLLYVATTRARDLLIIPAVADERRQGWLGRLAPVIYPAPDQGLVPLARSAPGCPEFRSDLAGVRPPEAVNCGPGVAPGLHQPERGDHRVVWWDPALLRLDVRETMGLRQTVILQADEANGRSEAGKLEYQNWRRESETLLAAGAAPSLRVTTATATAAAGALPITAAAAAVEVIELERSRERPRGPRFGSLVHALLARVPLDADAAQIRAAANFLARALGAPAEEVEAATAAVTVALAAPILRRAAAASKLRRETPLVMRLADGTLVEGVTDLAFLETDADGAPVWTVIDFKTDADLGDRLDEYRAQVAIYTTAIARATASRARGIVLMV